MTTLAPALPAPLVPGVVDLSPLRAGGFAVVHRGYQRDLDRWVAVKVITGDPDVASLRRFERECAIAGRLCDNPNALTVYGCGHLDDGRPYLLTELCEGGSLADLVAGGAPLPVERVVAIGSGIGALLARMHATGVVHRDVKPANILLRACGEAVLADFGLALRHDDADLGPHAFSPSHAAPEILAGQVHAPAADVYALGSTLYTLLFGEPKRPTPPHRADLDGAIVAVVLATLAPEARDRPTAAEVVRRLAPSNPAVHAAPAAAVPGVWHVGDGCARPDPSSDDLTTRMTPTCDPPAGSPASTWRGWLVLVVIAATLALAVVALAVVYAHGRPA
jgi:serine/threonine protein kinase